MHAYTINRTEIIERAKSIEEFKKKTHILYTEMTGKEKIKTITQLRNKIFIFIKLMSHFEENNNKKSLKR